MPSGLPSRPVESPPQWPVTSEMGQLPSRRGSPVAVYLAAPRSRATSPRRPPGASCSCAAASSRGGPAGTEGSAPARTAWSPLPCSACWGRCCSARCSIVATPLAAAPLLRRRLRPALGGLVLSLTAAADVAVGRVTFAAGVVVALLAASAAIREWRWTRCGAGGGGHLHQPGRRRAAARRLRRHGLSRQQTSVWAGCARPGALAVLWWLSGGESAGFEPFSAIDLVPPLVAAVAVALAGRADDARGRRGNRGCAARSLPRPRSGGRGRLRAAQPRLPRRPRASSARPASAPRRQRRPAVARGRSR